jgi:glycolate oxidase FAD binding subunit
MPATTATLSARLASLVGSSCLPEGYQPAYAVEGISPSAAVKPTSAEQAAEIIRFAAAEKLAVIPIGSRSKLAIGQPPSRYDLALDMTAIHQIAHYDPGDLTLSVDAGCTLAAIQAALAPHNQFLPLPEGFGPAATIAGTLASGIDSHLRQFFGTARDFLVGAEFIDGTGAQCKSGGRVVKNVTGYDLHKLLLGSLGTLAVITRLNFRTFPSLDSGGSQCQVFYASFPGAKSAVALRHKIAASPFTPDGIEILSPQVGKIYDVAARPHPLDPPDDPSSFRFWPDRWYLAVFFHGSPEIRERYASALRQFAADAGAQSSASYAANEPLPPARGTYPDATRHKLFTDTLSRLSQSTPYATIFKIAQLPEKLPELFARLGEIAEKVFLPYAIFARGVGAAYFALLPDDPSISLAAARAQDALTDEEARKMFTAALSDIHSKLLQSAPKVLEVCAAQSAPAQLLFAPTAIKRQLNALGPDRPDFAAMRRLKSAFDPHNIFAPGRLF